MVSLDMPDGSIVRPVETILDANENLIMNPDFLFFIYQRHAIHSSSEGKGFHHKLQE